MNSDKIIGDWDLWDESMMLMDCEELEIETQSNHTGSSRGL